MKSTLYFGLLALSALGSTAVAQPTAKLPKQLQKVLAMTPDQFAACTKLSDDSLDVIATLTTEPCFKETKGLLKIVWNDNFLRAHIDKRTGKVSYQVYQYISYQGEWRFYRTANYETFNGPRSTTVREIARNVGYCSSGLYSSGCTLSEHIAFDVDEPILREIGARWQPGLAVGWRFKFGGQAAEDWQDGMSLAEVSGMLQAVDAYRSAKNLPK